MDVDGVLTDGRLYYGPDGEALKAFHSRDGLGLALLHDAGVKLAIVSGRTSPVIGARARDLHVDPCLTGRLDKAQALHEVAAAWGLPPGAIAAIGDDIVDLPMLLLAGLSLAPCDSDPRVRARVQRVLRSRGGRGAVREACETILQSRGDWEWVQRRYHLTPTAAPR
jgi:3-deoxy-D-manno-octulosonate 8-phosphate phosphatase (KDO 8-P phosphatase)